MEENRNFNYGYPGRPPMQMGERPPQAYRQTPSEQPEAVCSSPEQSKTDVESSRQEACHVQGCNPPSGQREPCPPPCREPEPPQKTPKRIYQAAAPYPPVQACGQNRDYGFAMLDNIGGSNSEMSAVSLYFYNQLRTMYCKEIADCFHHISIVEMHHLEIFGTLAFQLGRDPRLWTRIKNRMAYWTPGYNHYPAELPELLKNATIGEEKAIEKYIFQRDRIDDCNIVENLNRIIMDEQIHLEIFHQLYDQYVC